VNESCDHCGVNRSERLLDVLVELLPVQLLHWPSNHTLIEVGLGHGPHLLDGCTCYSND
jgi:hypothetical protein